MSGAMVTYINLEILANLVGVSASLTVVVHSQVSFDVKHQITTCPTWFNTQEWHHTA